jgi:hypothetical protein
VVIDLEKQEILRRKSIIFKASALDDTFAWSPGSRGMDQSSSLEALGGFWMFKVLRSLLPMFLS